MIGLSVLAFPVAPRPATVLLAAAVVAAAVAGWPRHDRARSIGLIAHGVFVGLATLWLVMRFAPPWGSHVAAHGGWPDYGLAVVDAVPLMWVFYVLAWYRWSVHDIRLIYAAIIATTLFSAVMVFGQMHLNWQGRWSWHPRDLPIFDLRVRPAALGRATGDRIHPNRLALAALYGLIAAATLIGVEAATRAPRTLRRTVYWGALVLGVVAAFAALIESGSRVTWLAALTLLVAATLALVPRRRAIVLGAIAIVSAPVLLSVLDLGAPSRLARQAVPEVVWGRLAGSENVKSSDLSWRIGVWECGLELIGERPLTGVGLGEAGTECEERRLQEFPRRNVNINHMHNIGLEIAAEAGLPYLLLLGGWVVWVLKGAIRRLRRAPPGEERTLRVGLLAIVAGVLIVSQVNLVVTHEHRLEAVFWIAMAVAVAPLGAISRGTGDDGRAIDNRPARLTPCTESSGSVTGAIRGSGGRAR